MMIPTRPGARGATPNPLDALRARRILLADDDPHALLTHSAMLHALGAEVVQAFGAPAAMLAAAGAPPLDAAAACARMAVLEGHELIDLLRGRQPGLPAVLMGPAPSAWRGGLRGRTMMLPSKPALDDLLGALIVLLEPAAEAQARRAP